MLHSSYGFFEIAEVMPNTLDDANLEYITLKNNFKEAQSLSGYILRDASGKQYIFGEEDILESKERKQYFRTLTKIILNNTDETLSLTSSTGELSDTISYKTSTKGDFLSFEDIDIISNNPVYSREAYISDEVKLPDSDDMGGNNEEIVATIPEIFIGLQRPSYVIQGSSSDIFICDSAFDECKINFNFEESFTIDFPAKNFSCKIDFGLGELTGYEQKCNPNTLVFPVGITQVTIRISSLKYLNIFKEKIISIYNTPAVSYIHNDIVNSVPETPFRVSVSSVEVQSGLIQESEFQYVCKKEKCKVNLKYDPIQDDISCLWFFGEGIASSDTTYTRCNPGIVSYGLGQHNVILKIYQTGNEENFQKIRFTILNAGDIKKEDTKKDKKEKGEKEEEVEVEDQDVIARIELQGKIGKEKILFLNKLICQGVDSCNVNLIGIIEGSKKGLTYNWTLDGENISQKLNPKAIWLQAGNHEINFQVFYDDELLVTEFFEVEVISKVAKTKISSTKIKEKEYKTPLFLPRDMSGLLLGDILPNPAGADVGEFIEVQNTSQTRKYLEGCMLSDTAKNYTFGTEFLEAGAAKYFFKSETKLTLGNSKDSVTLTCGDTILSTISYERKIKDNELLSGKIFSGFTLSEILALSSDEEERQALLASYINIKFSILKRGGLKVTGSTFKNAKIEISSDEKLVLTIYTDSQGKILIKTKNIQAGNYQYTVKITQGETVYLSENIGNFKISAAQRASWFYKKPSTKKVIVPKIPQFTIKTANAYEKYGDIPNIGLTIREKLIYSSLLIFLVLLMSMHIFSLRFKIPLSKNIIKLTQIGFSTRQKILLLGV